MGLLSAEYPEGSLREMVGDGTDGDGAALSLTHLVVDLADVLGLPGGVVAVADDDIGSFDEGSLQALIGGFAHVSETGLPAAGVDGGDEAGVARELTCRAEAIDAADLRSMAMARMSPTRGMLFSSQKPRNIAGIFDPGTPPSPTARGG